MNLEKYLNPECGEIKQDEDGIMYAEMVDAEIDPIKVYFTGAGFEIHTDAAWVSIDHPTLFKIQELEEKAERLYELQEQQEDQG